MDDMASSMGEVELKIYNASELPPKDNVTLVHGGIDIGFIFQASKHHPWQPVLNHIHYSCAAFLYAMNNNCMQRTKSGDQFINVI